jgi:multisubunit Na+/H+ antiporter MnhF subunit
MAAPVHVVLLVFIRVALGPAGITCEITSNNTQSNRIVRCGCWHLRDTGRVHVVLLVVIRVALGPAITCEITCHNTQSNRIVRCWCWHLRDRGQLVHVVLLVVVRVVLGPAGITCKVTEISLITFGACLVWDRLDRCGCGRPRCYGSDG